MLAFGWRSAIVLGELGKLSKLGKLSAHRLNKGFTRG
jgi:hypothetical protein